jgi:hypothetical protein
VNCGRSLSEADGELEWKDRSIWDCFMAFETNQRTQSGGGRSQDAIQGTRFSFASSQVSKPSRFRTRVTKNSGAAILNAEGRSTWAISPLNYPVSSAESARCPPSTGARREDRRPAPAACAPAGGRSPIARPGTKPPALVLRSWPSWPAAAVRSASCVFGREGFSEKLKDFPPNLGPFSKSGAFEGHSL